MAEWHTPLFVAEPEAVPDSLQRKLADARNVINSLRRSLSLVHEALDDDIDDLVVGSVPMTLSVVGERGAGKSTFLTLLCASLRKERHDIVLSIARPELFGTSDGIIGAFLSSLRREVVKFAAPYVEAEPGRGSIQENEPAIQRILSLLSTTSRTYAVSQTSRTAVEHRSAGPYAVAEDSVLISTSNAQLIDELYDVVTSITQLYKDPGDTPRLIFFPIDDADLVPALIPAILRDLRLLSSIPGIVTMPCFSWNDLKTEWLGYRTHQSPDVEPAHHVAAMSKELEKLFPPRSRIALESPSVAERLKFMPFGSTTTLQDLLSDFAARLERMTGSSVNLGGSLLRRTFPAQLESPLPLTARSLEHLWDVLNAERLNTSTSNTARLVERLAEVVAGDFLTLPPNESAPLRIATATDVRAPQRYEVVSSIPTHTAIISRRGPFGERGTGSSLEIRPISGVYLTDADRDQLTQRASSTVLLLQELVLALDPWAEEGRMAELSFDDWQFLQRATVGGRPGSPTAILLPQCRTLGEVATAVEAWNSLSELGRMHMEAPLFMLDAAVRASCTWAMQDLELESDPSYENSLEWAANIYRYGSSRASSSTELSFRRWFDQLLPLQWTTDFFTDDEVVRFAEWWRGVRASANHPDDTRAFTSFDRALGRAIRRMEDEDDKRWLLGYEAIARELGSNLRHRIVALAQQSAAGDAPEDRVNQAHTFAFAETKRSRELLKKAIRALDALRGEA